MSQKGGAVYMRVPNKFLMRRENAIAHLDMDEITFQRFIVPMVASLKFVDETYFLSEQIEEAVMLLAEMSIEDE